MRPLIAISAYWRAASFGPWRDMPAALVPQGYVVGVQEAGGIAVLVPPDEARGRRRLARCSTASTAWCWWAATTSTRRSTAPSRTR